MWHYDLQSQLFDHLIHAWSWTGDLALEKMLRPAMGKLSHEPGKTGATRANLRPLGQWLREIVPVCSDATPRHFVVLRTDHDGDRLKAVIQAVVPAKQSIPENG